MNAKHWLALAFLFLTGSLVYSQGSYRIRVKIDGFDRDTLYLGYHLADKQYLRDTTTRGKDGYFEFKGNETLPGGMYLVVMPPDNNYFQLLIDESDEDFSVVTDAKNTSEKMVVTGSEENKIFYDYMGFLAAKRPEAEALRQEMDAADATDETKKAGEAKLEALNKSVEAYQQNLIAQHPKTIAAALVKANMNVEIPEFEGEGQDLEVKRWRYMQKHFFDNINMSDPRLLRTPFQFQRIEHYINKMIVQHPDTISQAIDQVLALVKDAPETYKFYLIHFLNTYAKSNIVGMDAVYVHLALDYYAKGEASWTDSTQLKKIVDNAKTLEPLLIGKIAPEIVMQTKDNKNISLHSVKSPYTVLFFWDPDCGHCKKVSPDVVAFQEAFKDKGVTVFAVCTKVMEEVKECWEAIDERNFGNFVNVVDPYLRSRYKTLYDLKTTPQIYVLDNKKEILTKRIGGEQLAEVMQQIIDMRSKNGADQ